MACTVAVATDVDGQSTMNSCPTRSASLIRERSAWAASTGGALLVGNPDPDDAAVLAVVDVGELLDVVVSGVEGGRDVVPFPVVDDVDVVPFPVVDDVQAASSSVAATVAQNLTPPPSQRSW